MELDKRIKEGKRPLTCFDVKEAKQFIGKKGYFTDELKRFIDLNPLLEAELKNVYQNDVDCFVSPVTGYKYFLPAEWVLPEEPKKEYRAFTLAEWSYQHEIGEVIHFMNKDYKQEFNVMYTGYVIDKGEDVEDIRTIGRIMLMGTAYFLEDLFENYVICINGEWQPFGVIEDD